MGKVIVSNCNLKINIAVLKKLICGKFAALPWPVSSNIMCRPLRPYSLDSTHYETLSLSDWP